MSQECSDMGKIRRSESPEGRLLDVHYDAPSSERGGMADFGALELLQQHGLDVSGLAEALRKGDENIIVYFNVLIGALNARKKIAGLEKG